MERFVVREPRSGSDYPQGNQMTAFSTNTSNMIPPETIYFSGPFASEFPRMQQQDNPVAVNLPHSKIHQRNNNPQHNMISQQNDVNLPQNINAHMKAHKNMNPHNMNAQNNMNASHNMSTQHNTDPQIIINGQNNMNSQSKINAPHSMNASHSMNITHNINAQHNTNPQHNLTAQNNMNTQNNMNAQNNINDLNNINAQHNMNARHSMSHQHNIMNPQIVQMQGPGPNIMTGQGHVSGIDPRYLSGYTDNSAQFIIGGQQIQRNTTPINSSFGTDYQNRRFNGIDRNQKKQNSYQESPKVEAMPKPQQTVSQDNKHNKNIQNQQQMNSMPLLKKPNELDLLRNDIQNQIVTRADKLKALYKSGPRAFSGPVEKVLKWHKSLQDIGVLIFYEVVAKCVSVRPGELCAKNLVVRDDNGPAMQVVYYEIDFLLPEIKPPCTVRVVGRMMAGTCRLQAFNVRPATGDDVATLPRRAAVAAHHVAKLYKEYGSNV